MAAFFLLGGCDNHDVGQPCPQLLADQDPESSGGTRLEVQETIEINASFPGEELICVATAGRSGYRSKRFREDAGCPAGFSCETIPV